MLIHDGVRPFADAALIDRVLQAVEPGVGALPCMPVSDTLKLAGAEGAVDRTVDRKGLYAAQTPQGFLLSDILAAHERARAHPEVEFTDDASIAEWAGLTVRIVEGSPDNIKLTFARDIEMAHQRLAAGATRYPDVRTGNGYDVHALEPGDHVTLCGVEIAHDARLSGHSDADVGLHALTVALLATCGAATSARISRHPIRSGGARPRASSSSTRQESCARRAAHRQCRHHADLRGTEGGAAPAGHDGGGGGYAGDRCVARVDQGDDQREARLHRAAGRHRGHRDGQRFFPGELPA